MSQGSSTQPQPEPAEGGAEPAGTAAWVKGLWRSKGWVAITNVIGPFLGLLAVIGLFCVDPEVRPYFLSGANIKVILLQTVILATCALGMTMIIVSGGIDLSVGSVIALTSVIGAKLLALGCPPLWAAAATVVTGSLVGAINGGIIAAFNLKPFIVTLGMMGIARGGAKWLAGNQVVNAPSSVIDQFMARLDPGSLFPLPLGVWLMIGLAAAMGVVMRQTVFGRHLFAIGSNEATARLCGIRVRPYKVLIYSVAGILFGLAGLMQMARLSQGDPTTGIGLELRVIAAVVIGGASLNGGTGSILGSIIGALIMAVLHNGSSQMGWPNYVQEMIIGAAIILAVGVDTLRQPKQES